MANERGKSIDNTHLSIDQAEARGFIHRDYIAHCLRWSHVAKYLQQGKRYETAHILDIGCGRDVPLARLLYSSRLIPKTGSYTGLDYNKLKVPEMFHTGKFPIDLYGETIFPQSAPGFVSGRTFDVITCFEVLEHVEPAQVLLMLQAIRCLLTPGGRAFLSTPCYDPGTGAAANHVNEMSYHAFGSLIEHAGLCIENKWGTFASIRDYVDDIQAEYGLGDVFEKLRAYYDVNYLATIFAPLFPDKARNCLWEVSAAQESTQFFARLEVYGNPDNSSSTLWTEFVKGLP